MRSTSALRFVNNHTAFCCLAWLLYRRLTELCRPLRRTRPHTSQYRRVHALHSASRRNALRLLRGARPLSSRAMPYKLPVASVRPLLAGGRTRAPARGAEPATMAAGSGSWRNAITDLASARGAVPLSAERAGGRRARAGRRLPALDHALLREPHRPARSRAVRFAASACRTRSRRARCRAICAIRSARRPTRSRRTWCSATRIARC